MNLSSSEIPIKRNSNWTRLGDRKQSRSLTVADTTTY